jgi:hypothetical protein
MSHGYQIKNQSALHYLTIQVVQLADIFTRHVYRDFRFNRFFVCFVPSGGIANFT